jgi:hypothetical protein
MNNTNKVLCIVVWENEAKKKKAKRGGGNKTAQKSWGSFLYHGVTNFIHVYS